MGEADYGHDARMAQYKAWLKRGAEVHGALSMATTKQSEELQAFIDHASEDQDTTFSLLLQAIKETELAVHTLGITLSMAALTIVGALGEKIPEPPPLPRPNESVPQ